VERHSTHNSDMTCAIVSCMFGGGLRGAECVFVARFSCPADSLAGAVVGRYTRLLPSNTILRDHDTQRLLSHTSAAPGLHGAAAAERAVPVVVASSRHRFESLRHFGALLTVRVTVKRTVLESEKSEMFWVQCPHHAQKLDKKPCGS
jgi:hypothetical protein